MNPLARQSAFPESYIGADMPHEGIGNGMTLRQYYAAKAMQALIPDGRLILSETISTAFKYADAMLAHEAKELES